MTRRQQKTSRSEAGSAGPPGPVLITGFEPFAGEEFNPSAAIAEALNGAKIGGRPVFGAVLPCVFNDSTRRLRALLERHEPSVAIALGLAGERPHISVERVAINLQDARIPDNRGRQPRDRPVAREGPAAYWSGLPVKAIVAAIRREGLPAEVSHTAGTFVCNHVFYVLMHTLAVAGRETRAGFIHVPRAARKSESRPAWPLDRLVAGIGAAVETAIRVRRDRGPAEGAVS